MAINLQKIRSDLNHGDPQIQTFALMSITRLSPQLVDSAQEIQSVYDKLQALIKSDNPDVVFLARKATNHIDTVFRPYFKDLGRRDGAIPVDPRTMGREDLLRILDIGLDPKYLASMVMRFIEVGRREDLSALQPFLSHADDRVRSNAVEAFQALGGSEQVELLLPLLKDRNNRVRGNAIMALVRLGYHDVRRNIEEMLCMGMISMRETAVYVLSQLDLPFVLDLLIKASADPYDGVRLRATTSLGNFITRASIVRLKQLMNDIDINICEAAVESLRKIKRAHEDLKRHQATDVPVGGPPPVEAAVGIPPTPVAPQVDSIDVVEVEPLTDDVEPEQPPSSAARPREGSVEARRNDVLRELGTEVYQLCRMNEITHESLDNVFYEILRYQDFLRAYLVKKQKGGSTDVNPRAAIEQLQNKIKDSFAELGRCAATLVDGGVLKIPADHDESVKTLLGRLAAANDENDGRR